MGDKWLVVGNGPSSEGFVPDSDYVLFICNKGIEKWPHPDYYWLSDSTALWTWRGKALLAQRKGTKLVTYRTGKDMRKQWEEKDVDFCIQLPPLKTTGFKAVRYEYQFSGWSGPVMVQFALTQGAKEIKMVGFDGKTADPLRTRSQVELLSVLKEAYPEVLWS